MDPAVTIDSEDEIRQANIFKACEPDDHTVGIVVTADCDLARRKAWDTLTWVPAIPATSYTAAALLFEEARALLSEHRSLVCTAIAQLRTSNKLKMLDRELLEGQIANIEDLSDLIQQPCPAELANDHALLRDCSAVIEASPPRHGHWSNADIDQLFSAAKRLATRLQRSVNKIVERARSKLTSPPGDVFLLPELDGVPYVVLLRFLREMKTSEVAPTIGIARTRGSPFYRFATLNSPYRYELTRRLGAVFSDIGLPDIYTERTKAMAQTLSSHIGAKLG